MRGSTVNTGTCKSVSHPPQSPHAHPHLAKSTAHPRRAPPPTTLQSDHVTPSAAATPKCGSAPNVRKWGGGQRGFWLVVRGFGQQQAAWPVQCTSQDRLAKHCLSSEAKSDQEPFKDALQTQPEHNYFETFHFNLRFNDTRTCKHTHFMVKKTLWVFV